MDSLRTKTYFKGFAAEGVAFLIYDSAAMRLSVYKIEHVIHRVDGPITERHEVILYHEADNMDEMEEFFDRWCDEVSSFYVPPAEGETPEFGLCTRADWFHRALSVGIGCGRVGTVAPEYAELASLTNLFMVSYDEEQIVLTSCPYAYVNTSRFLSHGGWATEACHVPDDQEDLYVRLLTSPAWLDAGDEDDDVPVSDDLTAE